MAVEHIHNRDFGYYEPQIPYPKKPVEPAILGKTFSALVEVGTVDEAAKALAAYRLELTAYSTATVDYNNEATRLHNEFRKDMAEAEGLTNHPKEALLYSIAYDYGHFAGRCEVYIHYSAMAELLKD